MVISTSDYAYFAKLSYLSKEDIETQFDNDEVTDWEVINVNGGINGFQAVAFGRNKGVRRLGFNPTKARQEIKNVA